MSIAFNIYRGATAEELGLTDIEYDSRLLTLNRFLDQWNGNGDFETEYLSWLKGKSMEAAQKSRGLGDTVAKMTKAVGIKPCGGCEKRRQWLNKKVPYKRRTSGIERYQND